jgi:hypothetical protein
VNGAALLLRLVSARPVASQAPPTRVFGAGVIVATQNPTDLDYRALSNADSTGTERLVSLIGKLASSNAGRWLCTWRTSKMSSTRFPKTRIAERLRVQSC